MVEEQKERDIDDKLRKVSKWNFELYKRDTIKLFQVQEDVERRNAQLLHDQEMAREHSTRVREAYHEQKMRQQIRENNQELRILESQLRTAYVSKALANQKKEREALNLAERIQQKQENDVLEKARLSHIEQLKKDYEADRERKKKLHEDLTNQIISAHQKHQRLYEEFLREKYYLDEIAQRIKEELIEQAQKKIELMETTKKEMHAQKIVKQEIERIQQVETEEENLRILEYCQQRDKKIQQEEKRREELEINRKNLNEKMVAELSELSVGLKLFNFISKRYQKGVNMLAVWKALAEAFKKHWLLENCWNIIVERNNSILINVHLLDDDINEVLHRFVDVLFLMLENKLAHQVHNLLTSDFSLARHVVDLKAIFDFLF